MAYCRQCGEKVVNEDGTPNFARQFCPPPKTCAKEFRRDELRARRAATKKQKRCSRCTQPILSKQTWQELKKLAAEAGITI